MWFALSSESVVSAGPAMERRSVRLQHKGEPTTTRFCAVQHEASAAKRSHVRFSGVNFSVVAGVSHPKDRNRLKKKSLEECREVPGRMQHTDHLYARTSSTIEDGEVT
jgi:hypothetical protein